MSEVNRRQWKKNPCNDYVKCTFSHSLATKKVAYNPIFLKADVNWEKEKKYQKKTQGKKMPLEKQVIISFYSVWFNDWLAYILDRWHDDIICKRHAKKKTTYRTNLKNIILRQNNTLFHFESILYFFVSWLMVLSSQEKTFLFHGITQACLERMEM